MATGATPRSSATGCPTRRPSATRPPSRRPCSTRPWPGRWSRSSAPRWPAAPRTPRHRRRDARRLAVGVRPGPQDDPRRRRTRAPPRPSRPTPLAEAGLSARALSALEPYGVVTVADLVAVDPVRLNRLSGVAEATRREVKARARQWRDTFGSAVTGRGPGRSTAPDGAGGPDPVSRGRAAAGHAGDGAGRVAAGDGPADPRARPGSGPLRQPDTSWPRSLGVTRARVAQQIGALQDGWADHRRAATYSTPSRTWPGVRSPTWAGSRP